MSFVDAHVVFLLLVRLLIQTQVVRPISSLSIFAWGNRHLEPFIHQHYTQAFLFSHRQDKSHFLMHMSRFCQQDVCCFKHLQTQVVHTMSHLLNQSLLGEPTLRTFYAIALLCSQKRQDKMSFVGTDVVFLPVECMLLQTLVVGTMSPLFNICLGKPTLRTLCPMACLCSHRQEKCRLLINMPCFCQYVCFFKHLRTQVVHTISHFLTQYLLGETHTQNLLCNSIVMFTKAGQNVICWYRCRVSASRMYAASNLGSRYHVSFIQYLLGETHTQNPLSNGMFMFTQAGKMLFVDTYVVFLLVCFVASNIFKPRQYIPYHIFLPNICLGKPTLRTFYAIALLCRKGRTKCHLLVQMSCFCQQNVCCFKPWQQVPCLLYSIFAWGNPHLEPFVQWHVYVHTGRKNAVC